MSCVDSIFGVDIETVRRNSPRGAAFKVACLLFDIAVVCLAAFGGFVSAPLQQAELVVFLALLYVTEVKFMPWHEYEEACIFYRRHKRGEAAAVRYGVSESAMFAVLYSTTNRRVAPERELKYYVDMLNWLCLRDRKYARRIIRALEKYQDDDGGLTLMVVDKKYYIGYIEEAKEHVRSADEAVS